MTVFRCIFNMYTVWYTTNIHHLIKIFIIVKFRFLKWNNAINSNGIVTIRMTYTVWVYDQFHAQDFPWHGLSPLAFCPYPSFHFLLSVGLPDLIFCFPMMYWTFCTNQHKQPTAILPSCKQCCPPSVLLELFHKNNRKSFKLRQCFTTPMQYVHISLLQK
jgi:hypothetical protein